MTLPSDIVDNPKEQCNIITPKCDKSYESLRIEDKPKVDEEASSKLS